MPSPIMLAVGLMLPSFALGAGQPGAGLAAISEKERASDTESGSESGAAGQTAGADTPAAASPASDPPARSEAEAAAPLLPRDRAALAGDDLASGKAARGAEAVTFDSAFLMQGSDGQQIDTTRFARGNPVEPGVHRLDLMVNGQWRGLEDVEFRRADAQEEAIPCFSRALLARAGVDLDKAARGQDQRGDNPMPEGTVCAPLARYVPGAEVRLDLAEQKLYLTVPRVFLRSGTTPTYVSPDNWDRGIPAARLNYYTNLFTIQSRGHSQTNGYAGLDMGVNIGGVRLRHSGAATWSPQRGLDYQRGLSYAQTDVPAWRSQVLAGESTTGSEFFDAVSFRGVRLSSDDRMLPDIYRAYAPVVRGTANSNARVTIHQRGYQIYETTVAPGPFAIDDLQAASYGGDLEVRVTEANGQVHTFIVPFATAVQMLRPGASRFSATVGQTNDPSVQRRQYLLQGIYQYGLDNDLTVYGGASLTNGYQSALVGAAVNTPVGAFAGDVTVSNTTPPWGGSRRGASYRLTYSKNLPQAGTNFSLLAYRYATPGYLSLSDAVTLRDRAARGIGFDNMARVRTRLDANISQQLGSTGGNVYLTGSSTQYWNQPGTMLSFAAGYGNQWRGITYSISAQRVTTQFGGWPGGSPNGNRTNTIISFNLSIPLGREVGGAPTLNLFTTHDDSAGTQGTLSASDSFGRRSQGNYNLSLSRDASNNVTTKSASINYRLPTADVGASVSWGSGSRQGSLSASGGVVAHQGGVTLARTLGETIALVHAPQAEGARTDSETRIDGRGYAVVTGLSPYRLNTVELDPSDMPQDVELKLSARSVAPRAGAIVRLDYPTRRAIPILIDSRQADGTVLPFAASVIDVQSGAVVGAVGQGSRLVIRTEQERGSLRVEWGGKQCRIDYALPDGTAGKARGFQMLDLPCQAVAAAAAPAAATGAAANTRAPEAKATGPEAGGVHTAAAATQASRPPFGERTADGWLFKAPSAAGTVSW